MRQYVEPDDGDEDGLGGHQKVNTETRAPGGGVKAQRTLEGERVRDGRRAEDRRRELRQSAAWKKLRGVFLRSHPFCAECGAPSSRVDHKLGHGPGWEKRFFDKTCLEALCESCHNRKTMLVDARLRGFGSPKFDLSVPRKPNAMELAKSRLAGRKTSN